MAIRFILLSLFVGVHAFSFSKDCEKAGRPWGFCAINLENAWIIAGKNRQGLGARILDIDTGVDISVRDIRGRIEKGKLFGSPSKQLPYEYYDEDGHGTTIVGDLVARPNGKGVSGVAPLAKVLAASLGSTLNDDWGNELASAIRWGIKEKVDVINIEAVLSDDNPNAQDMVKAFAEAYEAGIPVIIPAGNSGESKLDFLARQPNVMTVGALDVDLNRAWFSQYGPELDIMAPGVADRVPYFAKEGKKSQLEIHTQNKNYFIKSEAYVRSKLDTSPIAGNLQFVGLGEESDYANFLSGNIALIYSEERRQSDKWTKTAAKFGATAVIFINKTIGLDSPYGSQLQGETPVPLICIEREQGLQLKELLKASAVSVRITLSPSDYVTWSGTSGSAPYVTGVIALMKAVNPSLRAPEIYKILKETAKPVSAQNNEYGSGIVDAYKAVIAAKNLIN